MIPAFSACIGVARSRASARAATVSAMPITSTSPWPAPTVSRNTTSLPDASSSEQRLQRRLGEPAEMPARAHRADEDARVEEVVAEADAVAEQRALRERRSTGRPRSTPTLCSAAADVADERADQRRLADARRAGDADGVAAAGVG